jgi:hypothetical protein
MLAKQRHLALRFGQQFPCRFVCGDAVADSPHGSGLVLVKEQAL